MIDQYIRQYGKRLYGLCLTLCANSFDADDLYQDTWLKVVKNISQYDESREFEPWLTRICVNTYRNRLRRIMKSPVFDAFATEDEKTAAMESIAAPEAEDYSQLHEAINRLPEKLRITVILFYFQDMDVGQTSQALNIPPGTVKSRLSKARKLLKEVLSDETDLQF
ncbi:MAG: sigma-70 family RNA polymerase sigma factor [Lachnospiraceae bacterium]|nr:sigma-70 family RNA polymerase sigma factor [Lachnospiraceae bacterium]